VRDLLVPEVRHTDLAAGLGLGPREVSSIGDWYLDETDEWQYDRDAPSPGANPPVTPAVAPPREQDDLSEYDRNPDLEIVPTQKLGPLDEVLVQPPQDPTWRPDGAA
jgi:hypothetical protein